jgi:Tol biopolymer transport system component
VTRKLAALVILALCTGTAASSVSSPHAANAEPAIAYASDRHIWVAAADGTGAVDLTPDVRLDATSDGESQPAWSPDAARIVFVSTRNRVVTGENSSAILQELYVVPVAGGPAQRLTTNGLGQGKQAPSWSADGRWIAYVTPGLPGELWVVRPDGSGQHRLADRIPIVFESPKFAYAWSPRDPALVAYAQQSSVTGGWSLNTVDVDTSLTRSLASGPGDLTSVLWSSDGSRIAISVSDAARPELRRIEILSAGGALQATIPVDLFAPHALSWSPDGTRFSVTGWPTPDRVPQVYIADAASGTVKPLTRSPGTKEVTVPPAAGGSWWPTGERLFFEREAREPPWGRVTASINADGTCEQELSPGGRWVTSVPVWRPGASVPSGTARCADLWVLTELSGPVGRTLYRGLPRAVGRGTPARFPVAIWNVGTEPAPGVVLSVAGPATGRPGLRLASAGPGLRCTTGPLPAQCQVGTIPAGQALRSSVDVTFAHEGTWWFTIGGRFAGHDGTAWNNLGAEGVYVTTCRHAGTVGDDRFTGTSADDSYCGFLGNDVIRGGAGDDWLDGGAGADLILGGPGHDTLLGGSGADRIIALDGERDTVRCGQGYDVVVADRFDRVSGCEEVRRPPANA